MPFNFWGRLPIMRALEVERLLERSVRLNWGGERFYQEARAAGLSYRKQDMLFDYRVQAVSLSAKTWEGRARAQQNYLEIIEPLREDKGWHLDKAFDVFNEMKDLAERGEELYGEQEAMWEAYTILWWQAEIPAFW